MTWVIGLTGHTFGPLLIGDVQVSFRQPPATFDLIQKVHYIPPNLAIGFSGSVMVGFAMVESLRSFASSQEAHRLGTPSRVIWRWARRARGIWQREVSDPEKSLGCSLLVVGVRPAQGFLNPNSGYLLRTPNFESQALPPRRPTAIGSGSSVAHYCDLLDQPANVWASWQEPYLAGSGGVVSIGQVLAGAIMLNPAPGVSEHLHLIVGRVGWCMMETNDGTLVGGQTLRMPAVASDFAAYRELARQHGRAEGLATA
jgi:hypothetical protein